MPRPLLAEHLHHRLGHEAVALHRRVHPVELYEFLEVDGAVLSWTVDEPQAAPTIVFTDPSRADWLWRVLGEDGHRALAASTTAAACT